jgi:RsiW-degrading membrane proteinase PrsW (M82 family)
MAMSVTTRTAVERTTRHVWVRIFFVGLALWVSCIAVTLVTRNVNLVPTLILLGSFLVPVTFAAWAFEHWRDEHVTTELLVNAFVVGGLLGVMGASLLESYLLHPSLFLFFGVGLIEEGVKLAALMFVTRHMKRRHPRDGVVLGAAVGLGFAAFETMGYAFSALLTVRGLSVHALVETELLRSVLSPFGHGLWTAILGGVLFREARGGVFRYTRTLIGTYIWVSILHGLWDSSHELAVLVTYLLTGTPWQVHLLTLGYIPSPTPEQTNLFTGLSIGALAVVALLGVATLARFWRREPDLRAPAAGPRPDY